MEKGPFQPAEKSSGKGGGTTDKEVVFNSIANASSLNNAQA